MFVAGCIREKAHAGRTILNYTLRARAADALQIAAKLSGTSNDGDSKRSHLVATEACASYSILGRAVGPIADERMVVVALSAV